MNRRPTLVLAAFFVMLGACKDTDNDGLKNGKEKRLGTDPNAADSDGDYASDLREVDILGTDPLEPDSDGDGYFDGHEDQAGTDPLDVSSVIYQGGWPYNPRKSDIVDPGWDGDNGRGDTLPHFAWLDQFGDVVDIYDFAFQGKPIILDLSQYRCYWCHEAGDLLEGESTDFDGYPYFALKEIVEEGDVYWVTVIDGDYQTPSRDPADAHEDWYELYDHPDIPVLLDADEELFDWMDGDGVPTMFLINEDMTVEVNSKNYTDTWDEVLDLFAETCNGEDDDGDGEIDEDAQDGRLWYTDADSDAYGANSDPGVWACESPAGPHASRSGDCDDDDSKRKPGVHEDCLTSFDDDCDGNSNESKSDNCVDYFSDGDADGFGTTLSTCQCKATSSRSALEGGDCDDKNEAINPGATELFYDGVDQDCLADDDFDADGDGLSASEFWGRDCDDADDTLGSGVCTTEVVDVADAAAGISLLAADADALYFTATVADQVREVPWDGGAAMPTCAVTAPSGLALDDVYVYVGDGTGQHVNRILRADGVLTQLSDLAADVGAVGVYNGDTLIIGAGTGLVSRSLAGTGAITTLSADEGGVLDVAIDGTMAYWTTGDQRVRSLDLSVTDGAPATLASAEDAHGIGVDATHVYWVNNDGQVRRVARASGTAEDVVGAVGSADADVTVLGEWLLVSDGVSGTVTQQLKPE